MLGVGWTEIVALVAAFAIAVTSLAGGYLGARLQSRLPGVLIRRVVGLFVVAIGAVK